MDTKLLSILDEVYKTRSVTRAGENLGIPQATVSLALRRLRLHFNDPLFVRTGSGMVPTPHASALIQPIRQALELLQLAIVQRVNFDPASSSRCFRIHMTDISHIEFLPTLVNKIGRIAPFVRIEVRRITDATAKELEDGDSDLAIGYMPALESGFFQQRLYTQGVACLVRADHPTFKDRMTVAQFKAGLHVAITAEGTGHELVETELQRLRIERFVALSVPTLPGLGNLLANTDLIATVPERVGQMLCRMARVKMLASPMRLPTFSIKQHWHERYHQDSANRWLRSVVAELFLEDGVPRQRSPRGRSSRPTVAPTVGIRP